MSVRVLCVVGVAVPLELEEVCEDCELLLLDMFIIEAGVTGAKFDWLVWLVIGGGGIEAASKSRLMGDLSRLLLSRSNFLNLEETGFITGDGLILLALASVEAPLLAE